MKTKPLSPEERLLFPYLDKPLGEPKRKFSETFDGIKMMIEHFKLQKINHDEKTK